MSKACRLVYEIYEYVKIWWLSSEELPSLSLFLPPPPPPLTGGESDTLAADGLAKFNRARAGGGGAGGG